jgi:ATP-dependent DNA helicase RecG
MTQSFDKSPAEQLLTPVQFLKGVGPQRAELLARLGLYKARDILFFFPRDYQDLSETRDISELEEGVPASIVGVVEEIDQRNTAPGRSIVGVLFRQANQYLRAVWFNQPFMRDKFKQGDRVLLSGTVKKNGMRWEMAHPRVEILADEDEEPAGRVLPVYPLTEGINQGLMRRIVHGVVEQFAEAIDEVLPDEFLAVHGLLPIRVALPQIHAPTDVASLDKARERFIYQELLVLQLALALRRQQLTRGRKSVALPATAKIDSRIRRIFPFELTDDQNSAIAEVAADMARDFPMNRLVQGEVGSGKTVVAVYAMLLAVAHGYQTALMAPTEVLARQHAGTFARLLADAKVRVALLTGSLTAAQRRKLLDDLAAGEIDLVVGTQAIVQSGVDFAKLGLVVIDEQHRFGVEQRAKLRQAGVDPHYLVMTATPIPRTIGMTLFGDLDVSTIRQMPPGRQPVHSYLANHEQRDQWWEFFRKKLREGRQGYVVTPLVDESETVATANLQDAFEELANGPLAEFRLDLVHGRLGGEEKATVMDVFRRGETQVLVATSVVEVGVDVPNATLMTIEGGERFGLAQLHQLRGRISRGKYPGYVTVFADPQTESSKARLQAFVEHTDGFHLAEVDFSLRGPGDLLGTRQHGLPPLRVADLRSDTEQLEKARADARQLIADDPLLNNPLYAKLRRQVLIRYGKVLELGDVG